MHIRHLLTLVCIRMAVISNFVIMSFLINKRIFMKHVAKSSAFVSLSYQVHVKVCNPNS